MYIVVITISDGNYTTPDKIDITIYQNPPLTKSIYTLETQSPFNIPFSGLRSNIKKKSHLIIVIQPTIELILGIRIFLT